jgi:hypothetical protein
MTNYVVMQIIKNNRTGQAAITTYAEASTLSKQIAKWQEEGS